MARTKTRELLEASDRLRPALTPESRENQLIALAVNLAEQQLRDGTASSQVITHYLKQSTVKAQLEIERLRVENELIVAKREALQSEKRIEELYTNAIKAMKRYQGRSDEEDGEEYY